MKFETPIYHPNSESAPDMSSSCNNMLAKIPSDSLTISTRPVYPSGEVCISILHPPEEDKWGYESAAERWSPVQTPETILISVISMLSDPNDESAANSEAGKMWREDPKEFKKRVRKCVRDSQENAYS